MKRLAYFLYATILVSCSGNGSFKEEISSVDSLQVVVDELKLKMDSVNFDEMRETASESKDMYAYLSENYKDSTNRDFWINDMNALRQVMKIMMRHQENCNKTVEELHYTEKQLNDLRNSLKDGKVNKEEADQYLQDEKAAVNTLKMQVQKSQPRVLLAIDMWDTLQAEMAVVADSLRKLQ